MPTFTPVPTTQGEQPLDQALRGVHDAWVHEARCFLGPAMAPAADFWTGWAAVRYLADEFRDRYDLERGLVAELHSYVAPVTAQRLAREGQRLFRLRLELDRLGRRRGTAAEMGDAARRLLEQLVFWLAEVEQAAAGITRDSLTLEGAELLAHMEAGRPAAA